MKQFILLFCLSVAGIFSLTAQCTWTGAVNTNWSEAGNWSCGHVPGAADDVVINVDLSTVVLDVADVTISSLSISNGTTLTGDHDILINGDLTCGGASVHGSGTMSVEGVATITYIVLNSRNLILNGGGSFSGSMQLLNNAILTIPEGQTVSVNGSSVWDVGGEIVNHGIIEKNGAGDLVISSSLTNTGAIHINEGACYLGGYGVHNGAVISISENAVLNINGSQVSDFTNCTINGNGFIHIYSNNINLLSGNTISAKVVVAGTLNLFQNISLAYIDFGFNSTIGGTGTMTILPNGIAHVFTYTHPIVNCPFVNQGTLVLEGILEANNSFVNTGRIEGVGSGVNSIIGVLVLTDATVTNTGTVAPGILPDNAIHLLAMTPFNNSAATLAIDLAGYGGVSAPNGHDQLQVGSAVTLSGTLDISFLNGFTPVVGDAFTIMTCSGGCSGNFSVINHPGSNSNAWEIDLSTPNEVRLVLAEKLDQCTWDGSTGNWTSAAKWSCGHVPAAGDDVVINSGTVTLNTPTSANIATLVLTGGTLSGSGNPTLSGDLTISGGALNVNNVTISGGLDWRGGTIGGTGTMTVTNTTTITNTPTLNTRTLRLNGGGTIEGGFNTSSGGNLVIPMGQTLTCNAGSDVTWGGTGGTLSVLTGGTLLKTGAGILTCDKQNFQNAGTIEVNSGILRMGMGGTHTGATFNLATDAFLSVKSGSHTFTGCNFTGPGRLAVIENGVVSSFSGNTLSANMGVNLVGTNSTFNLGQDLDMDNFFQSGSHITSGTGNITVNGLTLFVGGTLNTTGNLNINGTFNWTGGSIGSNVQTNISPFGGSGTSSNTVVSHGAFNNSGTFTVLSGALTLNGAFDNPGEFIIQSGACTTNGVSTNSGILTLESGAFTANGVFNNTYLLSVESGTFYANNTFNNNGGSIQGNGVVDLVGATFNNTGYVSPGLSPGILTMTSFDNSNAYLTVELAGYGGAGQPDGHDKLVVNNPVALSGELDIFFINGFIPVIGDEFVIMTCSGGCTEVFDFVYVDQEIPGAVWQVDLLSNPNEVRLVLASALPVELVRFEGNNTENGALLDWQTASEKNNESFSVSHSTDGVHFDAIGKVPGKGNSTALQSYQFLHQTPAQGLNFYRLTITDFDGSATFSNIISVEQPHEVGTIHLSPNPTKGEITLRLDFQSEETTEMVVMDASGRIVQQQHFAGMLKEIDLTGQLSGVYTLTLKNGQFVVNQRIVLQ